MKSFAAIAATMSVLASPVLASDELTVAYFQEWPMPFQYGKAKGIYDERLGVTVNWVAFDSGTAMSAAMAAGDVQIAISQGTTPFIVATSAGQDLRAVGIAVSLSDNDNCVVASRLEIDKDSASELAGKTVALPVGATVHYTFLKLLQHFNLDPASMTLVDMAPAEAAAAFEQGSIDMACGWGGALNRMKESGNVLLSGAEKEEIGILTFDLTTTTGDFAAEQPQLLADFVATTAEMNAMWTAGDRRDEMLPVIAQDAGMDPEAAAAVIDGFEFPETEAQLSQKWLGGGLASYVEGVATMFYDLGNIPSVQDSYAEFVDLAPL
ncbi:ABC transporter substrate-binding protein, partial [Paracoccus homiensis]